LLVGRTGCAAGDPTDDCDPLTPDQVLVAPPGQHTRVTAEQMAALIPVGPAASYRPSADLLLTTLAIAAGTRVAAVVVVAGHGNDATAVHRFGGTGQVVPVDAVAGLPLAIATTPVIAPVPDGQ
jgi:two-component system, chemotaxis family, protein-glutamate methylesterase/glutaminase